MWRFGCLLWRRLDGVGSASQAWFSSLSRLSRPGWCQADFANGRRSECKGSLDLACMKCYKRVSVAEHLHNLSPFSLHSMIEVSAKAWAAWHATLYVITPWQYLPRLGIRQGLACTRYLVAPWQYLPRLGMLVYILSPLGKICRGLACYSISYQALAVFAEA